MNANDANSFPPPAVSRGVDQRSFLQVFLASPERDETFQRV